MTNKTLVHGLAALAAAGTLLVGAATATAEDKGGVRIGTLTCEQVGKRVNLVIHSSVGVRCEFRSVDGRTERYKGETGIGLGVDLNYKRTDKIVFAVIAANQDVRPAAHGLAGKYVGGKANVTAGIGAGAAALVGGGTSGIALQPLGLETSRGAGVAGGIGYLFIAADL